MHSATADSFKLSGTFRDPADFCVLTLFDADNFFEHPSLRYLPDMDFDGLTLEFDVRYTGLRNLDSPRYKIIDWPWLDVILPPDPNAPNSTTVPTGHVELFKQNAPPTLVSGSWTPARAQFTVKDDGLKLYDRLTLWFLSCAFDVWIDTPVETSYVFTNRGVDFVHSITVEGQQFSYKEFENDWDGTIAANICDQIQRLCPHVSATWTMNQVDLHIKPGNGEDITLTSTSDTTPRTLRRYSAAWAAGEFARQCNAVDWTKVVGADIPIKAAANGAVITFTADKFGVDGNALSIYAVTSPNSKLTTDSDFVQFSGGLSDATWHIKIPFTDEGVPKARKMWLTFAPPLSVGKQFEPVEWEAEFTNWRLSGPEDKRKLDVAGPGSFRIEPTDAICRLETPLPDASFTPEQATAFSEKHQWRTQPGFFSRGYAKVCTAADNTVTITYEADTSHELWLGTSLYVDRGKASVTLDGAAQPDFNGFLATGNDPEVNTRRQLASNVPPGRHTLILRTLDDKAFYFDYLDIVVRSDVADALPARTDVSPALDYSTDHTYKLPPARILWMFDKLGFAGPMNEYIGVFWWNQRKRIGGAIPTTTLVFDDTTAGPGDEVWIEIAGVAIGKLMFSNDNAKSIARHFASYINAAFVGLWAAANGNKLTLTCHSPADIFQFDLKAWVKHPDKSETPLAAGSLRAPTIDKGHWFVDETQSPALNRGARDWHADFFRECKARDRELVVASSMELVLPPAGFPAMYHDGTEVTTGVGYGSDWWSSHCAFNSKMLAYQKQVFGCITDLMADAGLTPDVQFGEYCWWYFPPDDKTKPRTMAFYDEDTWNAAFQALGQRELAVFTNADDDPMINGGADAIFLRNRLRDHVTSLIASIRAKHPNARFEVLFPYDVNYPRPAGVRGIGGKLLRFINFPIEWENPATAGFDRLKMEGLDWGAVTRDLDLAREVMEFPVDLGWPLEKIRYMLPIFNGGCPWVREYRIARDIGIPVINFWAFDHVCIFGLPVREPARAARAYRF